MADLLERLPENFEMITMQLRAKPLLEGEAGPFVVVALQVYHHWLHDTTDTTYF